jgi:hypothetical protein
MPTDILEELSTVAGRWSVSRNIIEEFALLKGRI